MSKINQPIMTPQWRYDGRYLEAPAERYALRADTISATREFAGRSVYCTPLHLAEKEWVRLAEFWPAFRAALCDQSEQIDPDMWARTYAAAEEIARKAQADVAERERQYAIDPASRYRPVLWSEFRANNRKRP